jgi:beta-glucosidase
MDALLPAQSRFPEGFLWGAGGSAHQVEGGNRANDWWRFEQQQGAIRHGDTSGVACDHYTRFDSDFALAAADHHNAHRLSFEWSRIEPARGRYDAAAIAHYHAVLTSLARHGLAPVVTLHHFTNPLWIADAGGWEAPETIARFVEFARFCAREYGAQVAWWCTVNEPEVFAFRGWSEGIWPPGVRDNSRALAVIANQLEAHGRAYRVIHEECARVAPGRATHVSFAKHRVALTPLRAWHPLDRLQCHLENRVFNEAVEQAHADGVIDLGVPGARGVKRHVPELRGALDFYGLNWYTRWGVKALAREPHVALPGAVLNDLGWELWPAGLEEALRAAGRFGKPVVITENGVADATDALRPQAIVAAAQAMLRARAAGVDVRGYLHWALLDNFEWAEGYHGCFGLYGVDFGDPARPRTRRRSAEVLSRLAHANALTDAVRDAVAGAVA